MAMDSPFREDLFANRVALVTGASRGIGAAIAVTFASLGAEVYLVADDEPGLTQTNDVISSSGGRAHTVLVDLLDDRAVERMASECAEVDILVNNAAPELPPGPLLSTPAAGWDKMYALTLWSPLTLMRAFVPSMMKAGGGCVINMSSTSARTPTPFLGPYAASKAALEVMTRTAALEFASSGIRVNAIAPSMVRTQRTAAMLSDPAFEAAAKARIPLGRLAETSDVANTAAWLASDAACFITGQVITVDGGSTAGTFNYSPPTPSTELSGADDRS
jgi:NAD(P)-dependent dehydrogenase (short-subunit alcohol dehydrogenase family)